MLKRGKGLRLEFTKGGPGPYAEQNNKLFQNNGEFGIREIRKLVENKAVVEVDKQEVICITPLSVVSRQDETGHRLIEVCQ